MFQVSFYPQYCIGIIHPPDIPVSTDLLFESDLCFVWGFLADPHFIQNLLGHFVPYAPASVNGLKRRIMQDHDQWEFRIARQDGGIVQGVVLIDLSVEDYIKLDEFEQVPIHMDRKKVQCMIGDLERVANIYLPQGEDFE